MGKGSKKRPCLVSKEEEQLRWDLAFGKITKEEFNMKLQTLHYVQRKDPKLGGLGYVEKKKR